jgi:RimJ/RimL family protein N-acetyltransferase
MRRLIDRYLGLRLEADLAAARPGRPAFAGSPRRLRCEESYGFIHALWAVALEDGRCAVSAPPGAEQAAARAWGSRASLDALDDAESLAVLRAAVDAQLLAAGAQPSVGPESSLLFACGADTLRRHALPACRRLHDESIAAADGLWLPAHCFPGGTVFGVVADGAVVSVAYAHRSGALANRVADIGVETAPGYRGRGYARACVSAVIGAYAERGGEALYGCSPANAASIATIQSCGGQLYGRSAWLRARPAGG